MENIVIKKKEYTPIKELGDNTLLVENNGKKYVVKYLGIKTKAFDDFKYAVKRMKTCNVSVPEVFIIDKKTGYALLQYIYGKTVFEELIEHDLEEDIYAQAFFQNWLARKALIQLDFNPHNFRIMDGKLFYMPFTFSIYKKENDFSQTDLRLWFYTKEFEELLRNEEISLQKSRLLNDYEMNKKLVLTVVKYYR